MAYIMPVSEKASDTTLLIFWDQTKKGRGKRSS